MGRFRRIWYKLLAVAAFLVGSYALAPARTLLEGQQVLFVGVLYGMLASAIHDLIGRDIVGVLVGTTESGLVNAIAISVTIVVYGGVIVVLLWTLGELAVAFLPGVAGAARAELRSLSVLVTALTVVVIEVINTEDLAH